MRVLSGKLQMDRWRPKVWSSLMATPEKDQTLEEEGERAEVKQRELVQMNTH